MKVLKKVGKILLILVLVLAILGGVGYAFKSKLYAFALAKMPGNAEQYHPEQLSEKADSPLKGKHMIFLGSSVTYGSASLGVAFPEYLAALDGIEIVKEAVPGTTLVTEGDTDATSYIPRMKTIDPAYPADCFICQLSTNDATQGKALGSVSDSFAMEDFDTDTVAGAIEYIIAYARETWDCPVVFYTGTRYDSDSYAEMVKLLLEIQAKWDIGVIDMWNDAELNAISAEDYKLYMANGIHPTQAGYLEWWTPFMEDYLIHYLIG